MYITQEILKQYKNIYMTSLHPAEGGGGGIEESSSVEKRAEEPMTPEAARELAEDSGRTRAKLDQGSQILDQEAAELKGEEGVDALEGSQGGDGLDAGTGETSDDVAEGDEDGKEITTETPGESIDDTMAHAEQIAKDLGFDEFLFESEEQANELRQELLDGLKLNGTESPEEIEALINEQFDALKQERLAELAKLQEQIDAELEAPNITPERTASLNAQRSAIGAMRNSYGEGRLNGSNGNYYTGGIGEPLSPELLAEYGETGHQLASYIQSQGYPDNGVPNNCGKNVGDCMNAFGIQGLPSGGRHGFKYAEICGSRPDQFKKIETTPQEAPAGAIISYRQNSGGSEARQQYGHVEIALGNNTGYYFGKVSSAPGGSQKPPMEGSYTIYMPTSKTPGGSASSMTS